MSPTVRTRVWRNGALEAEDFPIEKVSDYLAQDDAVVWADVLHPDAEILATLADELGLDPHAVEDAMGAHERPKVTRYPTHFFLTAYTMSNRDGKVSLGRVSSFLVKRGFVTVRLDDTLDMKTVLKRWDDDADLLKFGSFALEYSLLDVIVDRYFDVLEDLDAKLETIEESLFADTSRENGDVSKEAFECRRDLGKIRRAVEPMREMVSSIMHKIAQREDIGGMMPYYEDLNDHVVHATEWTNSQRDTIASIVDTNMSLADTRMNLVMKQLTAWAAIIAVPTLITGYFGQNVPYPGYAQSWGFWFSLVLMVAIAGALYVTFRRKDWL